ncbi:MAG: insulinase family protein [Oscillospiraceae bacterium]|nr:insulinase family protein [Oscillospiraceae bacterium]
MKRQSFSSIGESFFETTLSCGLRLRVIPRPGFAKTYAYFAMDYGAIDTCFRLNGETFRTPDGTAHYLEHKMFDMPYGDAMDRFAMFGGSPNAYTSYTLTAYYVLCTEHFEDNLRTLVEFVSTPYFTEKSVEKERGIIAQEIRMYEDSADSRVYDRLFSAMYANHPVRFPIAGTVESIQAITPTVLERCHEAFYAPSNAMLCVAGDVDPETVERIASEVLRGSRRPAPERDYGAPEDPVCPTARVTDTMEISMPTFVLGCKADAPKSPMRAEMIGDLAADCLFGSSTPFYRKLYESGLIDGSFSAGYEGMKGIGMFSAGGSSREPDAVADAIFAEARRVAENGLDSELFLRQKKATLGRLLRSLDSFEELCSRSCSHFFEGEEFFRSEEVFRSVEQSEVEQFIRDVLLPERSAISVILPKR